MGAVPILPAPYQPGVPPLFAPTLGWGPPELCLFVPVSTSVTDLSCCVLQPCISLICSDKGDGSCSAGDQKKVPWGSGWDAAGCRVIGIDPTAWSRLMWLSRNRDAEALWEPCTLLSTAFGGGLGITPPAQELWNPGGGDGGWLGGVSGYLAPRAGIFLPQGLWCHPWEQDGIPQPWAAGCSQGPAALSLQVGSSMALQNPSTAVPR